MTHQCYSCGTEDKELRPYGPRGQMVCYACAFSTPEKKAETEKNYITQLQAAIEAGNGSVSVGTEAGPVPMSNKGIH